MPHQQKERVFAEAKAMGASSIRLDIELHAVFRRYDRWDLRDWSGIDDVVALSRRYGIPITAVLTGVPNFLSACQDRSERCPPSSYHAYGNYVGEVAERTRGAISVFEVLNEPDTHAAFRGTPEEYARMLSAAHDAIRERSPGSRVLNGGVSGTGARDWLARVFATPGAAAASGFDVANVHMRGSVASLPRMVAFWKDFFRRYRPAGVPLWITEHGYPADTAYQNDPAYRGGEAAQAAYLRDSLPTLVRAGAARIFVSTRDTWPGEFGTDSPYFSEGVARVSLAAPYSVRRRPAAGVVSFLAGQWPRLPHTVPMETRLAAARDEHTLACFQASAERDRLARALTSKRRSIARLRSATRRVAKRHLRRRALALKARTRQGLRELATMKRRRAAADARAGGRCGLARIHQARIDTGS
ncbi:MAG: hypothetical protein JW895_15745 [Thermoleophilaceae bacterium]|nr:hypothetical protein [Thermoleophilaceae bacterium]